MAKTRLLKASSYYDVVFDVVYGSNPELSTAGYQSQYQKLMEFSFASADSWKRYLEARGDFEVMEVIVNAESLQKAWAKENGIAVRSEGWALKILEAQIAEFRPDIVFVHDFAIVNSAFRVALRRKYPFIRLMFGWDGIAINDCKMFEGCDLMLTCLSKTAQSYSSQGMPAELLHYGFDETVLERLGLVTQDIEASFVGSIFLWQGAHHRRLATLAALDRKFPLQFWVSGMDEWRPCCSEQLSRLKRFRLRQFSDVWRLGQKNRGKAFGLDMYRLLARSKVSLNVHIDRAGEEAANIRLIEATGTGTCLLTDWKPNLSNWFEEDKEVVTFRSSGECAEKLKWLINHPAEREAIATAGRRRTLSQFSFKKRMNEVFPKILRYLP